MMRNLSRVIALCAVAVAVMASFGAVAAAQHEVVLVVWDNWTRDAEQAMVVQLNAEFVAEHPGVRIVREAYDTGDLTDILPLALTDSKGPDVAMVNQGFTGMGALVEAGLLLPLNDYADQYGWWDRYAVGLHSRNSFTADGRFGEGNLYGMSNTAEIVAVYYHEAVFEELGLEIPATLAEFEALCDTLLEAGVTPIVFGSLDGWPAIHEYSAIQHAMSSFDAIDDFIFRREGATFSNEANVLAAEKLVAWIDKGYFSSGFEGMDYDNATFGAFLNKNGAMWITGSWMTGSIVEQLGEEAVGFFVMPPAVEGAPPLSIGGVGLAYGVRASSANADLAAEYIDLVTGPRMADLLFQQGFLPAGPIDPNLLEEGTLTAETAQVWQVVSSANAVGHYLDWTMPNIDAYIQELMARIVTPEEFVEVVEAEYKSGS